ncbi:MAG: hypothetical protein GY822_26750 [Deltaproteobacteria bacterium]|nr:hypothetical protein [Deltaproteobacteria bacterium]
MYEFRKESTTHSYVCRLSRGGNADDDFAKHIEELRIAVHEAQQQDIRLASVVMLPFGHPIPSAKWRAAVSKFMTEEGFDPDMAVITRNPAIRGVLTAISWTTSSHAVQFKIFPNEEAGLLWLEDHRGQSLPALREIVLEMSQEFEPQGEEELKVSTE